MKTKNFFLVLVLAVMVLRINAQVNLSCPADLTVNLPSGQTTVAVSWTEPTATTTCTTGGADCSQVPTSIPNFMYMGEFGGSHIFCSGTNNFTWQEAKTAANLAGGHLLVIDSPAKNTFAQNALGASFGWIGYTDQYSEGFWDWVAPPSQSYTNWSAGEPNDQSPNGGGADFAVIKKSTGKWYDRNGNETHEFIMEIDCPSGGNNSTVQINQTQGASNGSFFPQGSHTIQYQASDDCGNTANCSFVINVSGGTSSGLGSVGDFVWSDNNGNGIQDAGEPGLPNIFVMLTDCQGNWKAQTTTDASGAYSFSDLVPGSYKIKFVAPDMVVSPTHAGNNTDIDNDVNQGWTGYTDCFSIAAGQNRTDIDAGFKPTGNGCDVAITADITNIICANNNTPNNPNDDDFTFDLTVLTGAEWGWVGGGVNTDMSSAHQTQHFGPYPIQAGQVSFTIVDNDNSLCTFQVNVNPPATCSNGGTGNGSVGDFVWSDNNGNGIQDAGEPGLPNVFVMLTDCAGNWMGQTTTDASGAYAFMNLVPGSYKIKFVAPNMVVSPTHAGNNTDIDNDVNQGWTGFTDCFTIAAGQNRTDIDAGFKPNNVPPPVTILDPNTQPKFVNPLPIPSIMQPAYDHHYEVDIVQFDHDAGLIDPNTGQSLTTKMWGYNGEFPGPTFVVNSNEAITVKYNNELVDANGNVLPHILPVDTTIHWARPTGYPASGIPIVTHLHGGHTEAASDGYPDAWYTPNNGPTGSQFVKRNYTYDNTQEATLLWYHDHAVGITRLNVYAGLAGAYIIRDNRENLLNLPKGDYEIPLIISDKSFYSDGSLYYPSTPEMPNQPDPSILPEMFGDMILVNGKVWPVLDVEPRKYRFRVLNASDSRFYNLMLSNGMPFTIIGTDGGFIDQPITKTSMVMAPAERLDIILDFSDPALWGQTIVMSNDANTPYPGGNPVDAANAGKVMAFRVNQPLVGVDNSSVPTTLRTLPKAPTPVRTRQVTLNEGMDALGRLKPILGTVEDGILNWTDPITENPQVNEPEIWEVINLTEDAHPVHLHQIFFQVLDHQAFDVAAYNGTPESIVRLGQPIPEPGYFKDTYKVMPGEIARFAVNFDLPGLYVWHCHILSHEDYDMMRPLYVGDCTAPTNTPTPLEFMHCGSGTQPGTIGDFVWVDNNANGIQDAGEPGLANTFVMLTDCQGNWLNQSYTDASGHYSFDNLPAGDYKLKFAPPVGYFVAPTHAGNNPDLDNDVNQGWSGFTDCFTLSATSGRTDMDAGYISVSGKVGTAAILDLSLEQKSGIAQLQWANNTGEETEYFMVQRSSDGVNFKTIAQVESQSFGGTTTYNFDDFHPVEGRNYYQVVAITLAGNSMASNRVNGIFDSRKQVRIFPNPADNRVNIDLAPFEGQAVSLVITDAVGKVVERLELEAPKGLTIISLEEIPSGFYQVRITGENGDSIAKKLVIEKP